MLGEYHALISEMRLADHQCFYRYFHMMPERFAHLLSLVGPSIMCQSTSFRESIPVMRGWPLHYAIWSLAIQCRPFLSVIEQVIQLCAASLIVSVMLCGMYSPQSTSGDHESSQEELKKVSEVFENVPHCMGAIDGKHIVIQAPTNSGSTFYNYKGTISIVLLAVCDTNYCFILLDIGDSGRHSDGGVLSNSAFGQAMESGCLSLPDPEPLPGQTSPVPYFFLLVTLLSP